MKLIIAIIRPERLEAVQDALSEREVYLMTVSNVHGCGTQRGQTETFRGGIEAVPRGHREAAYSLGMPTLLTFRRIIARQVALATAPSIVNQFTVIVKSSTLVSVITVKDLMFESQKIVNTWYEPIEILTATAAIYIVIVFLVSIAGKTLADSLRKRYGISAA